MTQGEMSYVDELLDMSEEPLNESVNFSEIAQFFAGANVLITGGSGFVGKLLVEKLLRCCPDIATMFLLMRPKKGNSSEERFKKQFDNVLYDRLRKERPNFLSKIVIVEGDIGQENLGLSEESRKTLLNTHVVFHAAATVRFDESIRFATSVNIRGTQQMLKFAKEMPNIKAFVYISTAFCHCVFKYIEEKYYEPPIEPVKLIKLIEILDDEKLEIIKNRIIGKYPNTYAFTKAITEDLIREFSDGVPTCIVRPSIMIPTAKEPISAWIDNLYGATGACAAAAVGLMRTLHCDKNKIADIIPADYVISAIVAAAWDIGIRGKSQAAIADTSSDSTISATDRVPIYNLVSSCQQPIRWGEYMNYNERYGKHVVSKKVLWYYMLTLNQSFTIDLIYRFFLHLVPAAIVDTAAYLTGRKPILWKAYQKVHKFSRVVSYFATQEWQFNNDATMKLMHRLNTVDRKLFNFDLKTLDWDDYFRYHVRGLRIYLVGDTSDPTEEWIQKRAKRLKIAHFTLLTIGYLLMFWFLMSFLLYLWSFVH